MVIDTSAILAILQDEPERRQLTEAIDASESRLMSAATFVEASIVVESRFGAEGQRDFDLLVARARIEIVAVDEAQAEEARRAYQRYGKGRHSAGLNYGDVFAYALAILQHQPLLFKGEDFGATDVTPAIDQ